MTTYYRYIEITNAELLNEDGSGEGIELEDESGNLLLDRYSYGVEFMSSTLSDLTYYVARQLGMLREGIATGGSTTTLIDTNDRSEDDDYWNGGSAWIIRDAGGASATPEGEYSIISDFVNSTSTVTFRDAMTVAPASGDRYAIATDWCELHTIIAKINQAVMDVGTIPYTDTTSITIAADQTEYTLPAAASLNLLQVWRQTEDDSNDNRWREVLNWTEEVAAVGSASKLILPYQCDTSYDIKLVYSAPHPDLQVYSDALADTIPLERVVYPAIRDCFIYLKQKFNRTTWDDDIQRWDAMAENAKATRKIMQPRRPKKVMIVSNTSDAEFLDQVSGLT